MFRVSETEISARRSTLGYPEFFAMENRVATLRTGSIAKRAGHIPGSIACTLDSVASTCELQKQDRKQTRIIDRRRKICWIPCGLNSNSVKYANPRNEKRKEREQVKIPTQSMDLPPITTVLHVRGGRYKSL